MKAIETIKENLKKVFSEEPYDRNFKVTVIPTTRKGKPALDITVSAMYSTPRYDGEGGLLGFAKAMEEATGCNGLDITDEYSRSGCDTCDYGSSYGKTYTVWEE